jgi:hypothetical protein
MDKRVIYGGVGGLVILFLAFGFFNGGEDFVEDPGFRSESFGVFSDYRFEKGQLKMSDMVGLGAGFSRSVIRWDMVEPQDDIYNFRYVDEVVSIHDELDIGMMITLMSVSEWGARGGVGDSRWASSPPLDDEKWREFVQEVVSRYKGKVVYWQIENEIADSGFGETYMRFWNGTKEEYIEHLRKTREYILEIDPDAKIVLQGFANEVFILMEEGDEDMKNFFLDIMREAEPYIDGIDFHQYREYDSVREIMKWVRIGIENYTHDVEIFSTEAGDPKVIESYRGLTQSKDINDMSVRPFSYYLSTSFETKHIVRRYQAQSLVKRLTVSISEGVDRILWVSIKDFSLENTPDWFFLIMGLTDKDGVKKPHYYAYKLLIEKTLGFESVDELTDEDRNIKLFRYNIPSGEVYVAWSHYGVDSLDLVEYGLGRVKITEVMTKTGGVNPDVWEGKDTIQLTETPVFIEAI